MQNFDEDDLFLTADFDRSLVFKKSDPDYIGQIWIFDWRPTSQLHANQDIIIYGGRNADGATVGLYGKSGSANDEEWWRRETDGSSFLGKPECIQIKYDLEHAILVDYESDAKEIDVFLRATVENKLETESKATYEGTVTKTKETTCSTSTQNVHQFQSSFPKPSRQVFLLQVLFQVKLV